MRFFGTQMSSLAYGGYRGGACNYRGVQNLGKERWRLKGDMAVVLLRGDVVLLGFGKPFEAEDIFHK